MNGSEGLVIWHNKYIRVTLRNIKEGNGSQKERKAHPDCPGEVDFKNDILMASKDRKRVSRKKYKWI